MIDKVKFTQQQNDPKQKARENCKKITNQISTLET